MGGIPKPEGLMTSNAEMPKRAYQRIRP